MSDHEKTFSYDDTLLAQGQYRQWFWKGMDEKSVAWLKAPVKVGSPPDPEPIYKNQSFPQVKRWRDKASCRDSDPVLFFGEEGADLKKVYLAPDAGWRKLCPQCPVKELCLEVARKSGSVGIFGGKLFAPRPNQGINATSVEFDEETVPRKGRPKGAKNKPKNPMLLAQAKRQQLWEEKQKEINDRISNS